MYVRDIGFGQECGNVQIYVDAGVERAVEVRFPASPQRFDGTAQQLGVQRKADFLNLSALRITQ